MIRLNIEEKEKLAYLRELDEEYYPPTGTYELYDYKSDTWYNHSGQVLRSPDEYNPYSEGYTPFGDE